MKHNNNWKLYVLIDSSSVDDQQMMENVQLSYYNFPFLLSARTLCIRHFTRSAVSDKEIQCNGTVGTKFQAVQWERRIEIVT